MAGWEWNFVFLQRNSLDFNDVNDPELQFAQKCRNAKWFPGGWVRVAGEVEALQRYYLSGNLKLTEFA